MNEINLGCMLVGVAMLCLVDVLLCVLSFGVGISPLGALFPCRAAHSGYGTKRRNWFDGMWCLGY